MVAVELSRLLRRALVVGAVGVAGWLLGIAFAGSASADELPDESLQLHSGQSLFEGIVGGLTGTLEGVTDAVSGIADSLVDVPAEIVSPIVTPQPPAPVVDTPVVLPANSGTGGAVTDRLDVPRTETVDRSLPPTPAPVAPALPPVVAPVAPAPPPAVAPVIVPAAPGAPVTQDVGLAAAEHAEQGDGPQRQPAKAPGPGSGTTASATHDSSGGARGTHGVLPAQDVLRPTGAGFTTRSLAVDAAGRSAGLPASSPD